MTSLIQKILSKFGKLDQNKINIAVAEADANVKINNQKNNEFQNPLNIEKMTTNQTKVVQLNPINETLELYKVVKVMKVSKRKYTIEKNLTEAQAQRLVQNDIQKNPDALKYMLIYTKQ